jgi:hypothetical protein
MGDLAAIFPVLLASLGGIAACSSPPVGSGMSPPQAPGHLAGAEIATPTTSKASGRSGFNSAAPVSTAGPDAPAAEPPALPSPAGTAVLHIGDSFAVSGFSQALRPRLLALGVRYEVRAEQSSFTTTWAGKMPKIIADTQPDLVIINLGANEVRNTDPSTHASYVRRIVRAIGDRPCVWISPPLWRKDTGITGVIREHSAPCRFFDTDTLVTKPIPRQSDGIHPNEAGGAIWAEAFWAWLSEQRAPPDKEAAPGPSGAALPATSTTSRWRLKPAPPEEHGAGPHGSDARDARLDEK